MMTLTRALLASLALTIVVAPLHAQSLAEASKIAAAQREAKAAADAKAGIVATPWPKRVYTVPEPSTIPATAPVAATATESDRQADAQQSARRDEPYWKARMQTLRSTLDADALQVVAMEIRVASLSADFNESPSVTQRMVLRRERETAATDVLRLRAAVLTDRNAIATAEEEARRASVPSGWLRP